MKLNGWFFLRGEESSTLSDDVWVRTCVFVWRGFIDVPLAFLHTEPDLTYTADP